MKYPWAQVGRKVVCIDDRWHHYIGDTWKVSHVPGDPVKGQTYTITGVIPNEKGLSRDVPDPLYLRLQECPTGYLYPIRGFRPTTDISVFQKMLTGSPVDGSLEEV